MILDVCPQVVLLAEQPAELLRLLAVSIEQADFAELPISKEEPREGCTGDDSSSDDAEGSFKRVRRNMLCRQRRRGTGARSTDQRCLDTGDGVTRGGIVQDQDGRRASEVAGPVFGET